MAETIILTGVSDLKERLAEMNTTSDRMQKDVRKIIKYVLQQANKQMKQDAKGAFRTDPRKAYMAVRWAVYKRIFGGNVNIISRRKNNGKMYVGEKERKLKPGQRGGNRMPRSARTNALDSYYGSDRGFILRFLNAGTSNRITNTHNADRGALNKTYDFASSSDKALQQATEQFDELISRAIEELWNKQ